MSWPVTAIVRSDAPAPVGFAEKIWRINWGLVAGADGDRRHRRRGALFGGRRPLRALGGRHAVRYGVGVGLMLVVALIHPGLAGARLADLHRRRCCCWSRST